MGKIIYEPKKKNEEQDVKVESTDLPKSEARYNALIEGIDSVRPVGDTGCEYGVYLEDYAYTYTYQYASTDLGCEHSGILLGEYYADTKETIICGVMPIPKSKLSLENEWINEEAVESLRLQKEKYFPGASILGWFHMQPGYGTMLTMKEVKVHRGLFDQVGTLLLLVDPINKIETFYAYQDGTLKEQTGYFLYYDKNPSMQQYMLDNPFFGTEKEAVDDSAVHQFREIGKIRKKEYEQRKRTNFTVVAASIAILALGAVVIKMSDQNKLISKMQGQLDGQSVPAASTKVDHGNNGASEEEVQFIINPPESGNENAATTATDSQVDQGTVADTGETSGAKVVDNTKLDLTPNQTPKEDADTSEDVASTEETTKEEAANETDDDTTNKEENYITYKVEEGDTLRSISYDHYQTEKRTKDIISLNAIENGDQIYVGQTLKLPEK